MGKSKQKARARQSSAEAEGDRKPEPPSSSKAEETQNGTSTSEQEHDAGSGDASQQEPTWYLKIPFIARTAERWEKLLEDYRFQVAIRIAYVILSTIGTTCMIREHPTPVMRGWNIVFIITFFILNALIGLVISNREVKLLWLFLRSFSTWRFLYVVYEVYPQHTLRTLAIISVFSVYGYYLDFDRKAVTALVASVLLVASDTPKLRGHVWKGERAREVQIALGAFVLSILGGWRIYRWFALTGIYLANSALLMADFVPSAGQAELHQIWVAAATTPSAIVYHLFSEKGLPSYFGFIYLAIMLLLLRANVPNDGIVIVRSMLIFGLTTLLELFAFGMGARFVVFLILTLIYLVWMA